MTSATDRRRWKEFAGQRSLNSENGDNWDGKVGFSNAIKNFVYPTIINKRHVDTDGILFGIDFLTLVTRDGIIKTGICAKRMSDNRWP